MRTAGFNIVLIGYRGTGKSSVAQHLSARLGWPCYDADAEIERAAGKSIVEIFADGGEPAFREWETRVIERLAGLRGVIIATGGGAILRPENRAALQRAGRFVWLRADANTIQARLQADASTAARRPSLTQLDGLDEINALLLVREPIYAALADLRCDTEARSAAAIADEIAAAWRLPSATEGP